MGGFAAHYRLFVNGSPRRSSGFAAVNGTKPVEKLSRFQGLRRDRGVETASSEFTPSAESASYSKVFFRTSPLFSVVNIRSHQIGTSTDGADLHRLTLNYRRLVFGPSENLRTSVKSVDDNLVTDIDIHRWRRFTQIGLEGCSLVFRPTENLRKSVKSVDDSSVADIRGFTQI